MTTEWDQPATLIDLDGTTPVGAVDDMVFQRGGVAVIAIAIAFSAQACSRYPDLSDAAEVCRLSSTDLHWRYRTPERSPFFVRISRNEAVSKTAQVNKCLIEWAKAHHIGYTWQESRDF
jgi:hypothetical protein